MFIDHHLGPMTSSQGEDPEPGSQSSDRSWLPGTSRNGTPTPPSARIACFSSAWVPLSVMSPVPTIRSARWLRIAPAIECNSEPTEFEQPGTGRCRVR